MTPFSNDPELTEAWESLPDPFIIRIRGERGTAKSVVASVLCRGYLDRGRSVSVILVGSTLREFLCRAAGVGVLFYGDLVLRRMTIDVLDGGSSVGEVCDRVHIAAREHRPIVLLDDVSRLKMEQHSPSGLAADLIPTTKIGGMIIVGGTADLDGGAIPDLEIVLTREGRPVELSRADAHMGVVRPAHGEIIRFLHVGADGFNVWAE